MKRVSGLVFAAIAIVACNDDPTAPAGPGLDFVLSASPDVVDSKSRVEIQVRIVRAVGVEYPLTVTFEKANVGEPFFQEGQFILQTEAESTAVISPPLQRDPRIRATVTESSPQAISISKTIAIDVVDFP